MTIPMSPVEQVQAQLARQKWAVDTRDAEALNGLYTADSAQVIYQGGPDGRREVARSRGRDEIIAGITAGWERTAATEQDPRGASSVNCRVSRPCTLRAEARRAAPSRLDRVLIRSRGDR